MGRTYAMSWEGKPNFRWTKMYRGRRLRVSCDELGVPKTKEESYQAANRWWQQKLAELTAPTINPEKREALGEIERKLAFAASHAPDLVAELREAKAIVEEQGPDESHLADQSAIEQNLEIARLMGISVPDDIDPTVLQHLFGDRRLWQERLKRANIVERDRTVDHNLGVFLDEQRRHQKPATYKELSRYLRQVRDSTNVWTAQTDVATINEQTVRSHYLWLIDKKYVPDQHNKRLGFFRRFVEWLWTQKLLDELPRNLKRKDHRKKKIHKEVKRFTGVAELVENLPRPYRLWALLGLNCGMTNADLGETTWEQIDQQKWTLTRRRAKTKENPSTPTVTYKLWPETITQLKARPTRTGLLFFTKNNKPLYETKYTETGEVKTKDLFATYWGRLDPEPPMSLGKFRSVAATALKSDKVFRQYEDYFLAHTPKTIADQHYGAEDDEPFFEALAYVREKIFGKEDCKTK